MSFLRGETPFDSISVADTVTLYVSPEAGGARTMLTGSRLRDRRNWQVSTGARTYELAPPANNVMLTTRVGAHFNCREYELSSRYPDLADLPHVGTKLEPENPGSCLQSWNLTLVFDAPQAPRLVAAVYDQWEW